MNYEQHNNCNIYLFYCRYSYRMDIKNKGEWGIMKKQESTKKELEKIVKSGRGIRLRKDGKFEIYGKYLK